MGLFDDVLQEAQRAKSTGLFDDVLPKAPPQVEPASPKIARPTLKEKPDGFIDSLSQGFKRSMPETKSLAYGAVGAVGGALGMDGVRDWGLENYQRVQENEVKPLEAEGGVIDAVTGDGSLANWAGDTLGNFAGQAVQSLAVSAAGALAGGAAGTAAGGVTAVPGAALGAIGGLVARKGAKELIEKGVKKTIEEQLAKGATREAAEAAGEAAMRKGFAAAGGSAVAGFGLNAGQEVGISYTARAEDAEKAGEELTQGDAVKALGFGTAAGLVDTVAEALMAGRLLDGVSVDPSMAKRMAAGMIQGAMTEGGTEAVQAVLERAGASQELTSKEAILDYIENAAAGALGGGVGGAAGGFRQQEEYPVAGPPAADPPPVLGLPAPDGSPGFGTVQVSPDGTATTAQQREGLANVGLTQDVIDARTQHPAAAPVLVDGSPIPNPAGGVLSRAVNRGVETGAVATTNPAQLAAEMAMQSAVQQAMGGQVVPQVADAPVPATTKQPRAPIGMDPATGEIVQRTPEEVVSYLASSFTPGNMPKVSAIQKANGFDMDTANRVRREALAAQKENRNANNQSGAPDQTVDQGRESAASDGVELPAAVPAGEIGSAQAAQEPARDAAPAPVRAEPRPEAATVPQALTYSDSTDLLDDDITPPSGGAFSERGAAELMARRTGGGAKAVKIDEGWVVRKPGPQFQSGVAQPVDTGDGATDFLGDSRLAETLGAQSDDAGLIQLGADPRISAGEVDSAKTLYESVSADPQGLGNELAGVSDSQEIFRVGDAPLDASGADINPGTEQGSPGYAGTDSVLPSYSSDTHSSRTVGYEKLDGDRKSVVKARVLGGLNDPKVLQSVIELSPVQVMDVFAGKKVTTNRVRNNKSVLLDRLASAFDDPVLTPSVSSFIDAVVARHPDAFAGLAAEMKAGTSEGAGRASDNGTAVDTNAAGHAGDIGTFSQPTAGTKADGQPTSTVDEATVRADYREAMQAKTGNKDFDWGKGTFADTLVSALNRDPKAVEQLRGWVNGGNDETLKVWAKHAGVKLPRSKQARREAIDAWAGITAEQRADSDAAKAKAKQDKKDAETTNRRARQPIPDFANVNEAHAWWKSRAKAWPSEGAYRATPEYAEFVEKTRPLYAEHKNERVAGKKDTLAKAGLKVGDRVQSSVIGSYMTSQKHTGVIVMRAQEPWVKLDAPVTVSRNKRLHEVKMLRWTADWTKEVVAGAEQPVMPPRGQQLGRDEGQRDPGTLYDREVVEDAEGNRYVVQHARHWIVRGISMDVVRDVAFHPSNAQRFNLRPNDTLEAGELPGPLFTTGLVYDLNTKETKPAPDGSATHADASQAPEVATDEVIAEAAQTAERAPRVTMKEARTDLLKQVDAAMKIAPEANWPTPPELKKGGRWTQENRNAEKAHEAAIDAEIARLGYVTFDVEGDGKFKVINSQDRLAEFRAKIEKEFKSPKDHPVPRPASTSVSDAERAKVMAEAETVEDDFAPASPTPAQEASAAPAEPAAAIDDFGERLEGARKFMPPSLREELGDEQIASQPLSKLWPADAHVGIEDPTAAALAFAARAEVPAKPRKAFKVKRWVEQVKLLRTLPQNLENAGGLPQMEQWAARIGVRLDGFFAKVRLLAQLPRETWGRVERVGEHPGAFRYEDGKQVPAPFSTVTIDGKSHRFDVGAIGPDELQQVKELLGAEAAKKDGLTAADFEIRSYRNRDEAFISRKGDSERRPLKTFTGKDVVKQARAYLGENVAELEQAWEAVKARDNVGKADTRRDENRERVGENRRDGRDVTEQMFTDAFGFRGVQFGNWVKQGKGAKDRQGMLNEAYDALLDLADLLGIPSQAISLNGSLGLALGARGAGRASAHFERDNLVINLTKTKGAGSLAHEWFHALDNYFSRLRGTSAADPREGDYITYKPEPMLVSKMGFGTMTRAEVERRAAQHPDAKAYKIENWEPSPLHKEGVRPEVEKAFADLVAALNASPMAQRAAAIDGVKTRGGIVSGDGYWSRIIERGARAFENYVISKLSQRGWTNDFLANIRGWEQWQQLGKNRDRYPYLFPEEEAPVVQAFDAFFQMVQTKEEGGKVMLFSRIAPPRQFQPDRSEAVAFRQQFDRYIPSLLTNVPPLRVGRMPPVLRSLGVPDAIVTISRDIVRKASNKHSSERQALRALPEELADPVAVFESNSHPGDAMVVLTEIIDQKGQPVIVAIDIRRDGSVGRISSAYGKGSAKATFENWIKNGRLLYVSDRAKENAALKGLQLPNSNPRTGKVLRETDVVNSGDPASFSRAPEREDPAYSPSQVETDVADITARWVDSPPIEVVPTAADLPQDVVGELQRIGSDGSDIRGVYHPNGTIYVVRDNIISRRDLEETLFHEAIGHHGLRLMFGKGTERQLQRLVQAAGGWGGIKAYARRHGIDLSAYDFLAADPRLRDGRAETVLMDELFAHMAERMNDLEPSLRNRIAEFLGAVRAWLRQNGFELLAGSLSDGEMAHLLRRSERAVQGKSDGLAASVSNAMFSMRETGRGERFIERDGQRFVEREGAFYLTDKRGQPADFRRAEAERMAREVGGVAVKDDGLPTWSVRLPDTTARAEARASGMRFSRRAGDEARLSEEGERQFRETERAYGGRAAYDRAKAAGGTKLTYEQWVQVRAPSFKSWFGDWQALRAQKRLDAMDPIKVRVPEDWRGLSHVELRDRMASALDRMVRERAEIDHPEIGVIRVGRTGARKSEGSARDPAKSLVAADIESLIPSAVYARSEPSRGGDGKDIDGYSTLLARVDVDGVPLVAAFTIRHQSDGRWYYNAVTLHDGHEKARDSYGRPDQNGSSDAPIAGLAEFVRRPLSRVNPETVSKVTDPETGEPMVVYHGTDQEGLTVFDLTEARQNADIPSFFFTTDIEEARGYGDNVIAAFLNIRNPAEKPNARMRGSEVRKELEAQGFDGTRVDDEFAAFRPEQIKSAGSNNGDFSGSNPDIRFSRRADAARERKALRDALGSALNNARDVRLPAGYLLGDLLGKGDAKTLGWWHKTVGTMFNLAERSPEFKRVFDSVQRMIGDVSQYANAAMDMAPDLLPKFDSMRDWKKRPIAGESAKRVSRAVFEGTTLWTRDEDGRPVRTDDIDRAGIVWTAEELRQKFGMSPTEVGYYQQTRRAIDKSLNDTAISQMVKLAGDDVFDTRDEALAAPSARVAAMRLRDRLMEEARVQPRRASTLNETARQVMDMADKVDSLTERGYAPLSRFGRFTVYVTGDGMDPVFQMFETEREANRAARKLRGEFPRAQVEQGTLSEQQFRQFRGMTTETLELFGDILGLDATGDSAADQAFQSFLKAAKANRSAMKRLIHRQGIAGYSDDVSRVLANFIYSNARMTASNLNAGETAQAIAEIPKEQGQLKDAAIELSSYVDDPQDQGYKLGAFNFVQYIGGSIASAMVNLTQPLTMTFPWLSQYGGAWKAAAALKDAAMLAGKTGSTGDAELDHFLKRADADGITQPQEVHQLQAYAAGKGVLRSGDGTQAGDAAAKAYNTKARVMLLWGMPFSLAEQFNRRMTFIAAFNTARDQGMQDPYGFAVHAVQTTQGVYNKANKPAWARTTLGGMAFTFKQYSINYVEMLERMWRQGGPEGKKGVMLAMGVMYLLAGAGGLPGMDDLDDLIDGVLQRMGYNFDSKLKREQFFADLFGEGAVKFLEGGVSAIPGMPIDVAGRLGMGNLVPSTGLLKKKDNYGRDVAELAGPTGDFITRSLQAVDALVQGEFYQAGKSIAPKAIDNLLKGGEMLATGEYRDTKGRKVVETTTGEAIAKSIGFQPPNVAAVQRDTWTQQEMISLVRQRESEIAGKWAQGIVDAKQSRIDEARDELADWNAKNPETPIRINSAQIKRRVMQLRMDKRERVAKAAPKEIRAAVRAQLAD